MRYAAALVLAALLGSCSATGHGPAATAPADRLVVGQGREFNSLLAIANNGFTSSELIGLTSSLLVSLDTSGLVPDAALRLPTVANGGISRDGRTITYHLRHDIRWQDGTALTARDVLFTHSVVMDPHSVTPYRDGFDLVAAIAAPDPYTVVVHLKKPNRLFLINFLGPESPTGILPEHLLAHVPDITRSAYAADPVGSGPYRIVSWRHGDSVTFAANPSWYGGRPAIREIVLRFIPSPTTRLTQLRTHEIDAELSASTETADRARAIPGLRIVVETGPIFMHLSFNLRDPIGSQLPVRMAIAEALDARTIATKISHGLLHGSDGARGLFLWAYDANAGYPRYDPAAAQHRLDAAGWRRGPDGIRRSADGRRLALTVSLRADRADGTAAAVQIQQQLQALGIDIALKTYSAQQFTANDSVIRTGQFASELSESVGNIEPDPTDFLACTARGLSGFNAAGYCDPAVDADLARALETNDRGEVRRSLARVQRRTNRAMPMVYLWQGIDIDIVPARLKHFSDLLDNPFLTAARWSF